MLRKRRGVTLLVTLAIIAAMLGLVGILFGYLQQARSQASFKAAYIQADLLREDITSFLKGSLKPNPSQQTLQLFYSTPLPIYEEKGEFGMTAHCSALFNRIPLVWLDGKWDPKHPRRSILARKLFDRLSQQAELKEPERLLAMILSALRGKTTRFGIDRWLQGKKDKISLHTFHRLLEDYRFAADDPNVYKVEWEDYFLVEAIDPVPEKIDREFLTPPLVAYLFDQDPALVKEEYRSGNLSEFLASVGEDGERYAWLFEKNSPAAMECEAIYQFREGTYRLKFDYIAGRIENFALFRE